MLITKETDYALRILRALADEERVTAAELARGEQIPHQFAYKILKKLHKGALINITRGADGGCSLAAELHQVSLLQLMQIMEEDSALIACMRPDYQCSWCKAHDHTVCKAHIHLTGIQKKLNEELGAHSLQKILFGE
ncbi:MAG: Rrf2 family transcriptional regulator, nitric oxide-sensitive transcriptional repressor [Clostridiales bacterium]|jgi:Rrf2 family protein|nr:Rrf2 family transcriptional regulator, nitric oxide-sensitive transcriptional repressor [Clostridiales bacterium]MDN5298800.1 Rrf2 family transcriptional regulator, nitric oxide-sensitive transcriptional repressor [Clostridiales bacterium]